MYSKPGLKVSICFTITEVKPWEAIKKLHNPKQGCTVDSLVGWHTIAIRNRQPPPRCLKASSSSPRKDGPFQVSHSRHVSPNSPFCERLPSPAPDPASSISHRSSSTVTCSLILYSSGPMSTGLASPDPSSCLSLRRLLTDSVRRLCCASRCAVSEKVVGCDVDRQKQAKCQEK